MDNVFIERLWRSLKYEEVYLTAYKTVLQALHGIGQLMRFYNERRKHHLCRAGLGAMTNVYAEGKSGDEAFRSRDGVDSSHRLPKTARHRDRALQKHHLSKKFLQGGAT